MGGSTCKRYILVGIYRDVVVTKFFNSNCEADIEMKSGVSLGCLEREVCL